MTEGIEWSGDGRVGGRVRGVPFDKHLPTSVSGQLRRIDTFPGAERRARRSKALRARLAPSHRGDCGGGIRSSGAGRTSNWDAKRKTSWIEGWGSVEIAGFLGSIRFWSDRHVPLPPPLWGPPPGHALMASVRRAIPSSTFRAVAGPHLVLPFWRISAIGSRRFNCAPAASVSFRLSPSRPALPAGSLWRKKEGGRAETLTSTAELG